MNVMILTIYILAGFIVVVFVLLRFILTPLFRRAKIARRLAKEGVEAEALLLDIQHTGLYVNEYPQVKLQMQVQPRNGRNFITEAHEVLSFIDLSRLYVGRALLVKYNPSNIKEVMLLRH